MYVTPPAVEWKVKATRVTACTARAPLDWRARPDGGSGYYGATRDVVSTSARAGKEEGEVHVTSRDPSWR